MRAWTGLSLSTRVGRLLLAGCLALATGCSGGDGQTRFRVSGKVTIAGAPAPRGEVLFTPDGAQGNSGPQGIATIVNGAYDTQGSRAPGVAGGPTVVRVTALADDGVTLLREHEFTIDLPTADSEHDIDIPAAPPGAKPEI